MAPSKQSPKHTSLPPLPIRVARLHAKLMIAAAVGISVSVLLPGDVRLPTRVLAGWDVGIALYLGLTYPMVLRADVARIRKRASEQDEGAFAILLLTIVATLASMVAIVVELGGLKQAPPGDAIAHVLLAAATILLSWSFVHMIFRCITRMNTMANAVMEKSAGLSFPARRNPTIGIFSISRWSSA